MGWDGYGGGPGSYLEGLGGYERSGMGMEDLGEPETRVEVKGKERCRGQAGVWRA